MTAQLLPLRLLNSSVSAGGFSRTKLGSVFHPSRGMSIFTRVFPFKMKYLCLSAKSPYPVQCKEVSGIRRFSSRPMRSRNGRTGRNPEFSRGRGPERGEFQIGSFGGRGGQGKSLIEDEAELSDWVSDLKTDALRVGLSSESDDMDDDRTRDRGRGGGRGRGTGRDRDSFLSTRDQRGGRGGFKDQRGGREGFKDQRGGREGFSSSKRRRDSDSDDFPIGERRGSSNSMGSRNLRGSSSSIGSRNLRGSSRLKRQPDSDSADDDDFIQRRARDYDSESADEDAIISRRGRNNGSQTGFSPPTKRGGRDSDSKYGKGREGGNFRGGRTAFGRQALQVVEEDSDDDEDITSGSEDGILSGEESEEGSDTDVFKSANSLLASAKEDSAQTTPRTLTGTTDSYLSQTRFDQCSISPLSLKGIKAAGYDRMTMVQEATLPVILKGKDVLAKARTGTGKTVAFLLPAIEVVVRLPPPDRDQKRPPINVLIICPTRELASQAATEANALLKYHSSIGVQVVIGGTRLALEQKRMQANPCQILVATPGRLKDHIENTPGFATRLMGVKVLVLDEADHLLDMGFRKDIEKIIAAVPKQRQTLLFSATVPEEVRQICHIALKRDHEFINTVEEGSEETHSQVTQMHLVAPLDKHFSILYGILTEHISEDVDYKVLVFCTTAMVTRLVANLLAELNLNVREIHSRKPQSYRTRVSDEFRKSKGLILVTSDVSARGVDYPDVTLVIQLGVPADREQYIHRLGRTGRKGKEGNGILLLAPWEDFFLSSVKDLPITKASLPPTDPDTRKKVERALSQVEMKNKEAAYQAWLGYYNSNKNVSRDKVRLVELANEFSRSMGLDNPPAIPKLILGKMGLKNIPGLRSK
ncbi:DEAD-box ATP-dependent RNA helicase 31-like [Tasmannia lanceolata]|uniref:DEAD-box ATP-dependent RNA helicase 31-like n=1 Tax=Tasmannia lanceolata TaxID=3420 RepID=UPI004063FBE1